MNLFVNSSRISIKYTGWPISSVTKISICNIFGLDDIGDFWLSISLSTTLPLSSKCARTSKSAHSFASYRPASQTHLGVSLWEINPVLQWSVCHCKVCHYLRATLYIIRILCLWFKTFASHSNHSNVPVRNANSIHNENLSMLKRTLRPRRTRTTTRGSMIVII